MEENKVDKMTAEEIAAFHAYAACQREIEPSDYKDSWVVNAMKQYASIQSASLKAENDRLREALALICIHFPKDIMIDQMGEDFDKVGSLLSQPKEETK